MDVDKFLTKAETALRKRAVPQAIALYKQVLVASPDHRDARAGLVAAWERKAELKGGPNMLDKAAARSLRVTAAGLRTAGQSAAVVKNCEAGLERDPRDNALMGMLADALVQLERPHEALAVWEARIARDERDAEALKAAGRLHYEVREVAEAIDLLDRAHAIDPHDPEVEKLRKRLVAEGTLASTKYETATSSRELIKDKEAVRKAEQTQRLHRTESELAEDVASLSAALAEEPGNTDIRRRLARAQLRSGDTEAALTTVEEGLAESPEDDSLLELRGEIRLGGNERALRAAREAGDTETAGRLAAERAELEIEEYGRRVQRNPGDVASRLKLARACYRSERTDEAIEAFQALASDPRVEVEAREGLGACFFRKGLMPLARRQFEQALERAGGVGGDRGKEICYHLGLVCERLGETDAALARYMEIYEVDIHYKDVDRKIEQLNA